MAPKRKRGLAQTITTDRATSKHPSSANRTGERLKGQRLTLSATSPRSPPARRRRHNTPARKPDFDDDRVYRVRSIIDENKSHYLIDWEDDSVTGEKFAPTWEPKANANEAAVIDWKNQLRARAQGAPSTQPERLNTRPASSDFRRAEVLVPTSSRARHRSKRRPRRVVDSSPVSSRDTPEHPASASSQKSTSDEELVEIGESQPSAGIPPSPDTVQNFGTSRSSPQPTLVSAIGVQIGEPPSSYFSGHYERPGSSGRATQDSSQSSDHEDSEDFPASLPALPIESSPPNAQPQHLQDLYKHLLPLLPAQPELDDISSSVSSGSSVPAETVVRASSYPSARATSPETETAYLGPQAQGERPVSVRSHQTQLVGDSQELQQLEASAPSCNRVAAVLPESSLQLEGGQESTSCSALHRPGHTATNESPAVAHSIPQGVAQPQQTGSDETGVSQSSNPFLTQIAGPSGQHAAYYVYPPPQASKSAELDKTSDLAAESLPQQPSVDHTAMERSAESTAAATEELHTLPAPDQPLPDGSSVAAGALPVPVGPPVSAIPPTLTVEIAATLPQREPSPGAQDELHSPSAIPAVVPEEIVTKEDMNTSERYPSLLPQTQARGSLGIQRSPSIAMPPAPRGDVSGGQGSNEEVANVHDVPIHFLGHQRDQYFQEIYYHGEVIESFLAAAEPTPDQRTAAEAVVARLRNTAIHPDLNNPETATQHPDEPERQARWDVDCSAKFRFLDALFKIVSGEHLQIAVVARGKRICEILQEFCRGVHVSAVRGPGAGAPQRGSTSTTVLIVDVDAPGEYPQSDAVVALDSTINHSHPTVRALRTLGEEKWAPMFSLVVPKTVEHIERCLLRSISPPARLRALVYGSERFKHEAGRPEAGQTTPSEAAAAVAAYMASGGDWPLTGLSMLDDLVTQTDSQASSGANVAPANTSTEPASVAVKRPLDDTEHDAESASPTAKRVRGIEEPADATVNPQDVEITHVSDSIGRQTQPFDPEIFSLVSTSETAHLDQQFMLLLASNEARIGELTRDLEDLQYRHEDQRQELLTRTKERDSAIASAQSALEKVTRIDAHNSNLRAERTELKAQLTDMSARLADHTMPERRELETVRLELDQAKLELAKAEKRAEATERDLAYTRTLYQDASSRAQEFAQQSTTLQEKVTALEKLVAGEQARARDGTMEALVRKLQKENQQLKTILLDRNAGLSFRDEEIQRLKEVGRGRIGTRNSSVPRTPRVGSPYRSGRGSRQTSPSAGLNPVHANGTAADGHRERDRAARGHPLRNSNAHA